MSKSRKGKQASKNLLIKRFEKIIDDKVAKCPFDKRTELFEELENWAKSELNDECCDMFLEALYNAQSTQDIQLSIAVEKAIIKHFSK